MINPRPTPVWPEYPPPTPTAPTSTNSVSSRGTINSTSLPRDARYATIAAEGAPLPIVYGRDKVGGLVFAVATYGGALVCGVAWCLGEIEAVESIAINGDAVPSGVTVTSYTGAADQSVDRTLEAAISGYADALNDTIYGVDVTVAYSVIRIPAGAINGFPRFEAIIQGRKVYDPRDTLTDYSNNPALCLADFLSNSDYGAGRTVDWASVDAAADACDDTSGGEVRRTVGLTLQRPASLQDWIETLRTYAGCWVVDDGGTLYLVPDRPASVSRALTMADVVQGTLVLERVPLQDTPTVVRVLYTDESTDRWRDAPAVAMASGVTTGAVPWQESVVRLPGVHRYSQAYREAVERLNKLYLYDLRATFETFDEGLQDLQGDVITLTHAVGGLSAKKFRVMAVRLAAPGRWSVELIEYDEAAYSDAVESEPTYTDTSLPDPGNVPAVTGLSLAEEVYQLQTGAYGSRIRATWDDTGSSYPYAKLYEWQIYSGATLIWTGETPNAESVSGALQEGVNYRVQVRVRSLIAGVTGEWIDATLTAQGKQLPPSDVASITGFEAGGEVRLSWLAAIDIDIWRYEIRYGNTAGSWATANLLDRVDTLRFNTKDVAPGTWRFYVKALDSVGNYSANPAYVDITVTSDDKAFFVGEAVLAYSAADSTNIHEMVFRDGTTTYYSKQGTLPGTLYPSAMDTYTEPLATYDDGGAAEWVSDSWDAGAEYTGTWQLDRQAISALDGAVTVYLQLSDDDATWIDYTTLSIKATARYARAKVTTASGNTLLVNGAVTVRLDVIAREESGNDTSAASGATTITLEGQYAYAKAIDIQPKGTAARAATYDNVVVTISGTNSFDVYIFDASGTQVANDFYWRFLGV